MGLDVSAYSNVKECPHAPLDEDGYLVDYDRFQRVNASDFPERADDLQDGSIYGEWTDSMSFRAGSYSGYNSWRNHLAMVAGYPEKSYVTEFYNTTSYCVDCWEGQPGPFAELINFSDCEGVIGPKTSAKLLQDFIDFEEKAAEEEEWFYERYQNFKKAFELAAENGFVKFL